MGVVDLWKDHPILGGNYRSLERSTDFRREAINFVSIKTENNRRGNCKQLNR